MKSLLRGASLLLLAGSSWAQTPTITLVYPVFDNATCQVRLVLPGQYGDYLHLPIKDGTARLSPEEMQSQDSTFVVSLPETSTWPSFFITSEGIQRAKTPTPEAMAKAIVKQYHYYKTPIEGVAVSSQNNSPNGSRCTLSFKNLTTGQYMVTYIVFVNNRCVTIGTAHPVQSVAHALDKAVQELQKNCP